MSLTTIHKFDVKVGVIGPVSAGKTTALNALLGNKFSEVSMGRTTKAVNLFRISSLAREPKRAKISMSDESGEGMEEREAAVPPNDAYSKANEIFQEITSDNSRLQGCTRVEEKFFDIDLDEPLLKDMREDIRLVIADIPGVNEAGANNVYLDYVQRTWSSYDAIIAVMDAKQGVNTDEQIAILNFVRENLVREKHLPVIIICNKVDNPDDDELLGLVMEAQRKVENIFGVDDRTKALEAILGKNGSHSTQFSPAFLPASMQNAFVYKYVSGLHPNDLSRLDKGYLDKIGTQEVGMYAWKKLSEQEKYDHVYQIINDPAQYKERLAASNFDRLLDVLQHFVGGRFAQEEIIKKQLERELSNVTKISAGFIANELGIIIQKSTALEDANKASFATHLDKKFWWLYKQRFEEACQDFADDLDVVGMQNCMKELLAYANGLLDMIVDPTAKRERGEKILGEMKLIVELYIKIIISKEAQWTPRKPSSKVMGGGGWPRHWEDFSPKDWSTVIDSILMLEHRPVFYSSFGQEIVDLKYVARTGTFVQPDDYCFKCRSVCTEEDHEEKKYLKDYKRFMKGDYDSYGNLTPKKQGRYDRAVQIKVLDSPSDPSHWGYLAWLFCEYAESLAS